MDDTVIELRDVAKNYSLETQPWRRLWQQLTGRVGSGRQYHALHRINLRVQRGEVLGIIGRNGAGKSTLLQVVCGVLQPTSGERIVRGRIAALLELGAGFNTELTGRENVMLNGPLLGISAAEVKRRMDGIIQFAGIGDFIDQPVRSYSSGMFMRLAFSMATSMDPEILVVDEALSVGDGAFSRKSYDRIMAMRDAKRTILFCSHSMHPIESICDRVIWLENGVIEMEGEPAKVVAAYNNFLASRDAEVSPTSAPVVHEAPPARLLSISTSGDDIVGRVLSVQSGITSVRVDIDFEFDKGLPTPSVAVGIVARNGSVVASSGSHNDGLQFLQTGLGTGRASVIFNRMPLLKGAYFVRVLLMCERGIHVYDHLDEAAELIVSQRGLEQGYVTLPHEWPGAVPL
jgi:lipopolysaccharide transport system ATP-binding protein